MSRNIRARLERLEGRHHHPSVTIWDVIFGTARPDDAEKQRLRDIFGVKPEKTGADLIEEAIARAGLPASVENATHANRLTQPDG
jgi:hypothetical protein